VPAVELGAERRARGRLVPRPVGRVHRQAARGHALAQRVHGAGEAGEVGVQPAAPGERRQPLEVERDPPRVAEGEVHRERRAQVRGRRGVVAGERVDAAEDGPAVRRGHLVRGVGGDAPAVLDRPARARQVAARDADEGEPHAGEAVEHARRVPERVGPRPLGRRGGAVQVAEHQQRAGELGAGEGGGVVVSLALGERQRGAEVLGRDREVALRVGGEPRRHVRAGAQPRLGAGAHADGGRRVLTRLGELAGAQPVPRAVPVPEQVVGEAERDGRPGGRVAPGGGERPRGGRPQVVLLGAEARHRRVPRHAADDVRRQRLGEGEEVARVGGLRRRELAGRLEALAPVLTHGLEQAVARLGGEPGRGRDGRRQRVGAHHHQRLVDERGHAVEHVVGGERGVRVGRRVRHGAGRPAAGRRRERLVGAHRLGGGEREAAGEHRQPAQQGALARAEEGVAPLHRRPQRAVPRQRRAAPAVSSRNGVAEAARRWPRAAARARARRPSSMASGTPSRRRQISSTPGGWPR
jgi:hypothetical protein